MKSRGLYRLYRMPRYRSLYRRFGGLSMVPRRSFIENLFTVDVHLHRSGLVGGSYVECGTWAGGMSFAFLALLTQIGEWHFFDSFQGLPEAGPLDGEEVLRLQRAGALWHDNNTADHDAFVANLERANVRHARTRVHRGWFEQTLPGFAPDEPITVLRLDGDWYRSTLTCLEHLFHRVRPGGVILIDDYYAWDGCARAVHDFLSRHQRTERIRQAGDALAYLVKTP